MNLQESSLLHSLSSLNRYNAKDIADLCFLYMVALHILRSEFDFAPQARSYASKTLGSGDFQNIRLNKTDLYQLLNILLLQAAGAAGAAGRALAAVLAVIAPPQDIQLLPGHQLRRLLELVDLEVQLFKALTGLTPFLGL